MNNTPDITNTIGNNTLSDLSHSDITKNTTNANIIPDKKSFII